MAFVDGPISLDELVARTGGKTRAQGRLTRQWLDAAAALRSSGTARSGSPSGGAMTRQADAAPRAKTVRLLGVDPGTLRCGWGVIERRANGRLALAECGCITPPAKMPLAERLAHIFGELEIVIARTRPDAAALEETFAGINMKSTLAMGHGRGVALLALARAKLRVVELAPRSIKQAVTGSGAADKERVARMVVSQLGLKETPRPSDVTDALAAAIALANGTGVGILSRIG